MADVLRVRYRGIELKGFVFNWKIGECLFFLVWRNANSWKLKLKDNFQVCLFLESIEGKIW